jgi:hypothetical protein
MIDIRTIQSIVFIGADAVAFALPVTAPAIAALEALVKGLEAVGIIPLPLTAEQVAALRAVYQTAGQAAKEASDATTLKHHHV